MSETTMERGFLGLNFRELRRALRNGGLSVTVDEFQSGELSRDKQLAKAKDLARLIVATEAELGSLPRDVLIESAWNGIANYHREGTIWGFDRAEVVAIENEKDFRMSLLTEDEREQAIILANDWLDEHFDK